MADLVSKLRELPWEDIVIRLEGYALSKARRLYWPSGSVSKGGSLVAGWGPEDIAHEAIRRLFRGSRKWDPVAQPDVFEYLKGVVDSLLSALVESKVNELSSPQPESESSDGATSYATSGVSGHDRHKPPDAAAEFNDMVQCVLQHLAGEDDLCLLVLSIAKGCRTRVEIAEDLGISPDEVTKLQRRLSRNIDHEVLRRDLGVSKR